MPEIEKLISADYKIFLDTCSLMQPTSKAYMSGVLIPALQKSNTSAVVPLRVLDELRKLHNREDNTGTMASIGLETVALMLGAGVLEMSGSDEGDTFTDNYFLYTFTRLRLKHNLALVTQDKKLAQDINSLSNHRSVQGHRKILLLRIDSGRLVEWKLSSDQDQEPIIERKTKFQLYTEPRKISREIVPVKNVPVSGDKVYSLKYGNTLLREKIAKTRGGDIYSAGRGMACKIFSPKYLTRFQIEKLDGMLQVPVRMKGLCWPLDMVRNYDGAVVGYLMPGFAGDSTKETVFSRKSLEDNFPHWTRRELVSLCLAILKKIEKLHEINVLVGDINPSNVIVKNEKEVYFIETDACQVEDFPCLYHNTDFLAPELRGMKSNYLQTQEQEFYGLATLLFMILLPGKHPFAFRSGHGTDRMRCTDFPYPLGEKKNNCTLGKPWNYIWSNLPYKIKRMFYGVFKENMRISASTWIKFLQEYLLLLDNGYISNELFPEKRKILNPIEVTCSRCGIREVQERKWVESLTLEGKIYFCEACLEEIRKNK